LVAPELLLESQGLAIDGFSRAVRLERRSVAFCVASGRVAIAGKRLGMAVAWLIRDWSSVPDLVCFLELSGIMVSAGLTKRFSEASAARCVSGLKIALEHSDNLPTLTLTNPGQVSLPAGEYVGLVAAKHDQFPKVMSRDIKAALRDAITEGASAAGCVSGLKIALENGDNFPTLTPTNPRPFLYTMWL
jgi:hypothetical protein